MDNSKPVALVFHGLSGNLKSTLASLMKKEFGTYVVPSVNRSIHELAAKMFGTNYQVPTDVSLLIKLFQMQYLSDLNEFSKHKVVIFDKTSIEAFTMNRLKSLNMLRYPSDEFKLSDESLKNLVEHEQRFFEDNFSKVINVLFVTEDISFIKSMISDDTDPRGDAFGSVEDYISCQSLFTNLILEKAKLNFDYSLIIEDFKDALDHLLEFGALLYLNCGVKDE